jgi:uncharacterized protein YecE (DUF72 family)
VSCSYLSPQGDSNLSTVDSQQTKPSLLVGVGGWAYLPIKVGNKLQICSQLYDFVEVNSTFYTLPEMDRVKKWKKTVPETFEFTLRANRELTHIGHLEPTSKNYKIFEKHLDIAKELEASILHFQFPPSLTVTKELVKSWREFFRTVSKADSSTRGLKFALESRNPNAKDSEDLAKLIQDYDIIPTTDASRDSSVFASVNSKIVYTRVFGQGEHTKWTFDSKELTDLETKLNYVKARKRYVTFHNLTMYEDASRMKTIVKTGKDQKQPPTAPTGLDSLSQVIATGRVKFPVTKQALIEEFDWKTYNRELGQKAHVGEVLGKLEDRTYNSIEEVMESLEKTSL